MNTAPDPLNSISQSAPLVEETRKALLSALLDGELSAGELDALLLACSDAGDLCSELDGFIQVGDVLRDPGFVRARQPSQSFLDGIHVRLQAEGWDRESAILEQSELGEGVVLRARTNSANDPVFRWKLVAGIASLAAVMAVSWTVVGSLPSGVGVNGTSGQLALVGSSAPALVGPVNATSFPVAERSGSQALVVATDRGPLIRDARLEALLAEHRHGGVSALQMPAGFLRNATYDEAGR